MSFLSFLDKDAEELSILLDIGNGSINGALAKFSKNKLPKFVFTAEVPFTIKDEMKASELASEMRILLDLILNHIIKQGLQNTDQSNLKITQVLITFSSPWFALKTKHITLNQPTPFLITKDFLEDIIQKEEEALESEIFGENPNTGTKSFEIIEKSIVHTKINGYPLSDSYGKKTKNFEAYMCLSVINKSTIEKIHDIILKNSHIPSSSVLIHTFPIASFIVIRDIFSSNSDFIIMDITGEVTDITLVQDDVVIKSISMPSGRNFLIRQIAKGLGLSIEIAQSTIAMYSAKKLDDDTIEKFEAILVNVEREWAIYLASALEELSPLKTPPSTVYLTSDSDFAPIYKEFLSFSKTDSTAEFRKNINLIHIKDETFSSFYEKNTGVKVNEFIAILAIFYNKILQKK